MSLTSSATGFDPSPWLAANAALALRLGTGRRRGSGVGGDVALLRDSGVSGSSLSSLVSRSITGEVDEERRRRLAHVGTRGGPGSLLTDRGSAGSSPGSGRVGPGRGASNALFGAGSTGGAVSTAALLARGYQPAVVKVISYAHGVTRATASASYIERDEVELETHEGTRLVDKAAVAEEIRVWSSRFEKRAPSQDVVAVRVQLSGLKDNPEDRDLLASAVGTAFEGHRHALRIDVQRDGILEARVVAVMARTITPEERARAMEAASGSASIDRPSPSHSPARSSSLPPRLRVVEQRMGTTEDAPFRKVFDTRSEAILKARIVAVTGYPAHGISLEPGSPGHGRDALGLRLSRLIAKAPARDHLGNPVRHADDLRAVVRDWGRHLRSQTPRDTMHMVVSAKAGTDVKAFTKAVRAFLHDRFSDHKFMFGVHTDKAEAGHIHAHAIVAVRSESGTKLHPGPADLTAWRVSYAAHAREHGLEVVATRASEQASSRSYGPKDKSIVDVATTPRPERKELDRAYAGDPRNADLINNARERIATARANPVRIPETKRDRAEISESLASWRKQAEAEPANPVPRAMVTRLAAAQAAGDVLNDLKAAAKGEVSKASTETERNATLDPQRGVSGANSPSPAHHPRIPQERPVPMPRTADQLHDDLRLLNRRVAEVSALLPEGSRQTFEARAASTMARIAERIDQQRAVETAAPRHESKNDRQAMAPIIDQAREIARSETREAEQAEKDAKRAFEAERRIEAAPIGTPALTRHIAQGREHLRETEQRARHETREAQVTNEAARALIADPASPLPQAASSDDPLAELRRQQAEMLDRLSEERDKAKAKERGREIGD